MKNNKVDLLYVEGPGDVVSGLDLWSKSEDMLSITSTTYSAQVFDFAKRHGFKTLALSSFKEEKSIDLGEFSAYSKPKKPYSSSLGYQWSQLLYGLGLLKIAFKTRPKYLHITCGATHWLVLSPLKLIGTKIIPRYHNSLWPVGFYPKSLGKRVFLKLDAFFLSHVAHAALGVSQGIADQIKKITNGNNCPTHVFIPQFNSNSFDPTPPPEIKPGKSFHIVYSGRVEYNKGVYDILQMANQLKDLHVKFDICGDGSDLAGLREACQKLDLNDYVSIHGPLNRQSLVEKYQNAHLVIIPTRSGFEEGFAKVAAEAVLLNRPILTSQVVPAINPLMSAAIEATTNDVDSYVTQIKAIINDPERYKTLCKNCEPLQEQFFDIKKGLGYVMDKTL